jgi:hypothetical protein
MENFCAIGGDGRDPRHKSVDYIAASYINDKIGFRVITSPNTQIGYILNPLVAKISCVYPTDAATLARSDYGCGPHEHDPIYGLNGYQKSNIISRYYHQKSLQRYSNFNFGRTTSSSDIPCDHFYPTIGHTEPIVWESVTTTAPSSSSSGSTSYIRRHLQKSHLPSIRTSNETTSDHKNNPRGIITNLSYTTIPNKMAMWDAPYLRGSPPCNMSINRFHPTFYPSYKENEDDDDDNQYRNDPYEPPDHWWIYLDHASWNVTNFQNVMDAMQLFIQHDPTIDIWNEIVIDLSSSYGSPVSLNQMVLAVFFIVDDTDEDQSSQYYDLYQRAYEETQLLRHREDDHSNTTFPPVLIANITALKYNQPLFQCADRHVIKRIPKRTKKKTKRMSIKKKMDVKEL